MQPAASVASHAARVAPSIGTSATRPRRRARRVPYRVPCRVRLANVATGEVRTVVGETVNISPAGFAVQLAIAAPVGTWVETMVLHPNGEPLFLSGTVVHVRQTMSNQHEIGVSMPGDAHRAFV
jgi:hypothetical protein